MRHGYSATRVDGRLQPLDFLFKRSDDSVCNLHLQDDRSLV